MVLGEFSFLPSWSELCKILTQVGFVGFSLVGSFSRLLLDSLSINQLGRELGCFRGSELLALLWSRTSDLVSPLKVFTLSCRLEITPCTVPGIRARQLLFAS